MKRGPKPNQELDELVFMDKTEGKTFREIANNRGISLRMAHKRFHRHLTNILKK